MKSEIVFERKGSPFTSSLIIAEKAEVQHESVARLISKNIDDVLEFGSLEFSDLKSGKRGRPIKAYYLNERQATLILTYMDNTEPVKCFKKALVKEFFRMSSFIQSLSNARIEYPQLTDAIMQAIAEPKPYHFSNEIDMINRIAIGMSAKQFKEENGVDKKEHSIRPYLTTEQIEAIEALQRADIGLILAAADFQMRKAILTNYLTKTQLKRLA